MRRLVKALHAAGYETGEVDVDFNWVSWNDGVTNEKHIAEDLAAVSLDTIPAVRGLLYVMGLTSTVPPPSIIRIRIISPSPPCCAALCCLCFCAGMVHWGTRWPTWETSARR